MSNNTTSLKARVMDVFRFESEIIMEVSNE